MMRMGVVLAGVVTFAGFARAIDEEHYRQARGMIEQSIEYLRTQQDEETGGWAVMPEGVPQFPAISALVLNGMLMEPDIGPDDPSVSKGVDFVLGYRQPDGGIYDKVLASYNTSITLSALARVNTRESGEAIQAAQAFLKGVQWSEDALDHPETGAIDRDHPYYGGVGYGGSGRPDNSNLTFMLQGLRDSGLDCDDEAFERAMVFLSRTQMHEDVNDMPYAQGSTQGGFIYATSPNGEHLGVGESKAGTIEETLSDGTTASRLRAYGSMTYAGFKSYIYANLDRDDPRVQMAYDWIRANYTLEENPGLGESGMYYYFVTFSRAMDAWGLPTITTVGETVTLAVERRTDLPERDQRGNHMAGEVGARVNAMLREIFEENEYVEMRDEAGVVHRLSTRESTTLRSLQFEDGRTGELVGTARMEIVIGTPKIGDRLTIDIEMDIRLTEQRDWANDLIDRLAELQNEDGSFRSVDDRWMEDNPVLITAYALLALQHAVN